MTSAKNVQDMASTGTMPTDSQPPVAADDAGMTTAAPVDPTMQTPPVTEPVAEEPKEEPMVTPTPGVVPGDATKDETPGGTGTGGVAGA